MATLLLEGPFETDYGLAIVNRRFAEALFRMGASLRLHQRHNATTYFPPDVFPRDEADMARLPVYECKTASTITRYRGSGFPNTQALQKSRSRRPHRTRGRRWIRRHYSVESARRYIARLVELGWL
jgi:hypothetical protein